MSETVTTSQQELVGKYKPYPEYKDSGISRLGNIPSHWQPKKLKRMASIENGRDYKHVEAPEGFPVIGSGGQFTWSSEYIYNGESVLLGRKGTVDIPLYINGPFWTVDTMFYTKVCNIIPAKFLYYAALTIEFGLYSTNTALPSMTQEDLGNVHFGSPSYEEAENIAAFLDYETTRIDRLIAQQQRLIELLKEKRQSVISHAVTKGLNPNAPMKDSGIEWLGQVPEHWIVKPLRHLGYCQNGINIGAEAFGSGYPFVSYGDAYKNRVLPETGSGLVQSTPEDRKRYSLLAGDVLFTRTSETIEEIGFASVCLKTIENACFAGFLIRFRPNSNDLDANYSKYYFSNQLLRAFFIKEMNLITRASLSQDLLKTMPVVLPPRTEQKAIAEVLDEKSKRFDRLQQLGEEQIKILQERRTALISAAVTGKIDLRGWTPPAEETAA